MPLLEHQSLGDAVVAENLVLELGVELVVVLFFVYFGDRAAGARTYELRFGGLLGLLFVRGYPA